MPWVLGNLGQEYGFCPLIPEDELRLSRAQQVGENHVVVLFCAAVLDEVPLPRDVGIKVGIWIFPPPQLIGIGIVSEDEVQVAVTIDVKHRSARFEGKIIFLDNVPVPPAYPIAPVPHQSGSHNA